MIQLFRLQRRNAFKQYVCYDTYGNSVMILDPVLSGSVWYFKYRVIFSPTKMYIFIFSSLDKF